MCVSSSHKKSFPIRSHYGHSAGYLLSTARRKYPLIEIPHANKYEKIKFSLGVDALDSGHIYSPFSAWHTHTNWGYLCACANSVYQPSPWPNCMRPPASLLFPPLFLILDKAKGRIKPLKLFIQVASNTKVWSHVTRVTTLWLKQPVFFFFYSARAERLAIIL